MKKILIVNSFYFPDIIGGAEVSTQLLAEGLLKHYEVCVLTTGGHKKGVTLDLVNGVKVYRIPCTNFYWPRNSVKRGNISKLAWHFLNQYNLKQNAILKKVLEDISPDLIHTQNVMGIGTFVWNIAKKLNVPVAHTLRDYALIEPVSNKLINKFLTLSNRQRSEKVNSVVGISNFILNKHLDNGLFPSSLNCSIHNVVSAERYPKKCRHEGDPLRIGYYGQLEKNKGIKVLINAIKDIPSKVVGQVIICGVGSQEKELKLLVQNDKRFTFKGKIPIKEVYKTMASTDLTVVPSIWDEPFGRVIIESYMQGTPVIASNTGGITEIISSHDYIFRNKDTEELKGKITDFSSLSKKRIDQEINKAYAHAEKYSENISDYMYVYNSIMEKRNSTCFVKKIKVT